MSILANRYCKSIFKKNPFRRTAEHPFPISGTREIQTIANERDALFVSLVHHLKRSIGTPHQSPRPERLIDPSDQRQHVEVRRPFTHGVEPGQLYVHMWKNGKRTKRTEVRVQRWRTVADSRQVIDHHRCVRMSTTELTKYRERVRNHQRAYCELLACGSPKQPVQPGALCR
jgi:hypothetical protein